MRKKNLIRQVIRSRKTARLFSLIMTLVMVLVFSSFLVQYRNLEKRRQTQEQWYGSWQAVLLDTDDGAREEAQSNLVIGKTGVVQMKRTEGEIIIGSGEEGFFDMAHLSLKKGRMPQGEPEIAAEAVWLDSQGLSYELGQRIQIDASEYILSGILDSYSAGWTANDHLPQIWMTNIERPDEILLYMEAEPGYESVFDEWKPESGILVRNMNLELGFDLFSGSSLPWTIVSVTAVAAGVFLICIVLSRWTEARQMTFVRLKSMGADTGLLLRHTGVLLLQSALPGLLIILPFDILSKAPGYLLEAVLAVWAVILLVAILVAWKLLKNTPSSLSLYIANTHIPRRLSKGKQTVSLSLLASRWLRWNWKAAVFCPVLLAVLGSSAAFSATRLGFDREMEAQISRRPDFCFSPGERNGSMSSQDLGKIRNMGGVREIYSYTLKDSLAHPGDWTMTWENVKKAVLLEIPEPHTSQLHLIDMQENEVRLSPTLLEPEHLPPLQKVLEENGIQDLQAEEGVVYLPAFTWTAEENGNLQIFPNNPEVDHDSETFRTDTSLKDGDRIELSGPDGQKKTLTVKAILREPLNYTVDYIGLMSNWTVSFALPYVVIVPKGFFQEDTVNCVEVWTENRDSAALQSEMAAFASTSGLLLRNEASENGKYIRFFEEEAVLYAILTLLFLIVWTAVLIWSVLHIHRSMQTFLSRFLATGTDTGTIRKIRHGIVLRIGLIMLSAALSAGAASLCLQFSFVPNQTFLAQSVPALFDLEGKPTGIDWITMQITPWTYGAMLVLQAVPLWLLKRPKRKGNPETRSEM